MGSRIYEPTPHSILRAGSLVFTPTAGMRVAPQVLVLELFRELGHGDSRDLEKPRSQDFNDVISTAEVSDGERMLLSACRGRKRRDRVRDGDYYTPAYISLTELAWFRKQSDRAVRHFFLGGPLAHQEYRGKIGAKDKKTIVKALRGHRTARSNDDYHDKELLSLLIGVTGRKEPGREEVAGHLRDALGERASIPLRNKQDVLAQAITADFVEVCWAEQFLPRREWLFFLLAFLRIATAMWLLAHLRITVFVRDWLLDACLQKPWPSLAEVQSLLGARYEGLLHPTTTPTQEVFEHLDNYMRARVELRLLVEHIGKECGSQLEGKRLSLDSKGAKRLTLEQLLILARNLDWAAVTKNASVRQWLTREAEAWAAWRSPRNRGQGKHLREFIRVLYHFPDDDSGSSLLEPSRNGPTTKIVPGHRLLQLFAFLAKRRKARERSRGDRGRLVLRDIEEHMYSYGLDFRSSSCGRPLLLEKLSETGILAGSPDAGESAEVLNVIAERTP